MGGLVYRLRDRLVLGVRKLLVEAFFVLSSCGLKYKVDVVIVMSHCMSAVLAIR
jgi:hypothetical protein